MAHEQARASRFGALLRQYRVAAALSQAGLAARAGLSTRAISDLERGVKTRPYLETVRLLSEALGLDATGRAALLDAARPPQPPTPSDLPLPPASLIGREADVARVEELLGREEPVQIGSASLPQPLTSLVGREQELAQARALLDRGDMRLLTLTGPGGVGKTRVAIALATELEQEFAHGVRFVRLAAIRQPGLVGAAVAQALGVRATGGRTAAELLPAVLRDQHLLLVLDNLEQVTGSAPWLADLLAACPRLTVVATSRVALRLTGEQRFPLAPLPVPAADAAVELARLPDYAAIALFLQRAQAVDPTFRLTEANGAIVATICRQLDGLPLALELAAARLSAFDVTALARRLGRMLPLLTAGATDAPARLRTMRDAIAWSYDLLTPAEQALLRWLSVFLGGFALDAADAIGDALGQTREEATDRVATLVEQSLVRALPGERYGMLETIREFGLEQLARVGEEERARDAHAAWVRKLVAQAEDGMKGSGQIVWLDRLEAERANTRAAPVWLADHGAIEQALETAASLWHFWQLRGDLADGRRQVEELLARPEAAARTLGRARALNTLAILTGLLADGELAQRLNEEALAIFREHGDRAGIAWALTAGGVPIWWLVQQAETFRRLEAGLALYRDLGDRWHELRTKELLGTDHRFRGLLGPPDHRTSELAQAETLLRECLADAAILGDRWLRAQAASDLALVLNHGFDWSLPGQVGAPEADTLYAESAQLFRELGDLYDLLNTRGRFGELRLAQGRLAEATALYEEVLDLARHTGDGAAILWSHNQLGTLALRQGDPGRAAHLLRQALAMELTLDYHPGLAAHLIKLAELARALRQPERAARLLGAAGRITRERDEIQAILIAGRAEYEHDVTRVREALGDAAFQRAWAAGEALSFADMAAEADALLQPASPAPRPTYGLSPREQEVLVRMAAGRSNQEIADDLFISVRTVTDHVSAVLGKLALPSRTAAVAFAIRAGLA